MQADDWDEEGEMKEQPEFNKEPRIYLHAMVGTISPQTMRIRGAIMGQGITILSDSGSSHNFLNASSAKKMGLVSQSTQGMKVMVANGERLDYEGCCSSVEVWFQGNQFSIDFFLLAIEGCDIVLGTQWMCTLGPIWWDFAKPAMSFKHNGRQVEFKGIRGPKHKVVEEGVAVKELCKKKTWVPLPVTSHVAQGAKRSC